MSILVHLHTYSLNTQYFAQLYVVSQSGLYDPLAISSVSNYYRHFYCLALNLFF